MDAIMLFLEYTLNKYDINRFMNNIRSMLVYNRLSREIFSLISSMKNKTLIRRLLNDMIDYNTQKKISGDPSKVLHVLQWIYNNTSSKI